MKSLVFASTYRRMKTAACLLPLFWVIAACGAGDDPADPPTCSDGLQNGSEVGVDCGGSCSACVAPTCTDGVKNGNEVGVDCGGSCSACVTPKGNRRLAINPYPAKDSDDATAFSQSRAAGANTVVLGWGWAELELAAGVYNVAELDLANSVYAIPGFKVVVMVNPIESDIRSLPSDLEELAFDDPVMIARYKSLLDTVFERLSGVEIDALLVGNEANSYLGDNPEQFAAYQALYEAGSAHAKSLRPGIKVGVEAMWENLLGDFATEMQAMNTTSDVIATTYYPSVPVEGRFDLPDLTVMEKDMAALTAAYAGREIYLVECGYSSSQLLNSSEQEQADFVREAFRVWDTHESQISLLSFFMLHDFDPVFIEALLKLLGFDEHPNYDDIFEGFTTLGLRTYTGEDKMAFPVLIEEAAARGW